MTNHQDKVRQPKPFVVNIKTDSIICCIEATLDNGGNWCLRKNQIGYFYWQSWEDSPFVDVGEQYPDKLIDDWVYDVNAGDGIFPTWGESLRKSIQKYSPPLEKQLFVDTPKDKYPNVFYIGNLEDYYED